MWVMGKTLQIPLIQYNVFFTHGISQCVTYKTLTLCSHIQSYMHSHNTHTHIYLNPITHNCIYNYILVILMLVYT